MLPETLYIVIQQDADGAVSLQGAYRDREHAVQVCIQANHAQSRQASRGQRPPLCSVKSVSLETPP